MADDPPLPRTERPDAPLYLASYLRRRARATDPEADPGAAEADSATPLYLRRFRERRADPDAPDAPPPVWNGEPLEVTRAWAEITRTKEIVPEAQAGAFEVAAQVHIVRHGETQGYSTESGLTPLGGWQAHRRGFDLSKGSRDAKVAEPRPMAEFRNFQVATPDGLRDVTSAFRMYHALSERYERAALGDRPMWLVEVDRFWNVQQGGADPIHHWMTIPMLHFEPPASCVRRFWSGFLRLVDEAPGVRILCATHSGPIRAFAAWAVGYDPGEPYNTEEVLVKLKEGGGEALVAYRNRVQEVQVPPPAERPDWWEG